MDLPHKNSIAMAPDIERGHLWWFRAKEELKWRQGRTVSATGWLSVCYLELQRRVWHYATQDLKYCSHDNVLTFALIWSFLKALLLVQTVHEHSNNQIWRESPFRDVQVLFDSISPSSFTHESIGVAKLCKFVGLLSLKYLLKNQFLKNW